MDGLGKMFNSWLNAVLLVCCLVLSGCGSATLFNSLEEQEANEMIAILKQYGITATKIVKKEDCALMVQSNDFSISINLLESHGYPLPKYQTLGDVFKKSGLVSSPLEERVRFMNALSEGVALTLSKIPGVLKSRVHIVLPENDPYAEHITPSSAAVFIAYRQDSSVEDYVRQIKYLVTNSIEGLDFEKVSVALFPISLPPLPKVVNKADTMVRIAGIEMTDGSKMQFFMLLGALLAVILVLIIFSVWVWISTHRKKKERAAEVEKLAEASESDMSQLAMKESENKEESLD